MRLPSRAFLERFCSARGGVVAPLFALSFFLVIGAVGLAIGSARGYGLESHLQSSVEMALALDNTASMAGPQIETLKDASKRCNGRRLLL